MVNIFNLDINQIESRKIFKDDIFLKAKTKLVNQNVSQFKPITKRESILCELDLCTKDMFTEINDMTSKLNY